MRPNSVRQGSTFTFEFELSGSDTDVFAINMTVMQYPQKTPAISRALTIADGVISATLTSVETAALAVGQWFIHIRASDSDEDLREPQKLNVSKGWITT